MTLSRGYYAGSGPRVVLKEADFIGKGGEKSVYAKGGIAYCVYHDSRCAVPMDKIDELSNIKDTRVIRPLEPLFDANKDHVGETMRFVDNAFVLCQMFGNKFCRQNNVDNRAREQITNWMIEIMHSVHAAKCLMIDPNDCNWLVRNDLREIYAIDTSAYQTPSYPAQVIKPSIRDYTQQSFDDGTDWYSLAVILSWMWVGIHPFVAYHPSYQNGGNDMVDRMKKMVSFFDPKTQFNAACRPLSEIPSGLSKWLQQTFSTMARTAPPSQLGSVSTPVKAGGPLVFTSDSKLRIEKVFDAPEDIVDYHDGRWVLFPDDVYITSPIHNSLLKLRKHRGELLVTGDVPCTTNMFADHLFYANGNAYVIYANKLSRVTVNDRITPYEITSTYIKDVSANPLQVKSFTGCVLHTLSTPHMTLLRRDKTTYSFGLPELALHKIVSMKAENNVVVVHSLSKRKAYQSIYVFNLVTGDRQFTQVELPAYCDVSFAYIQSRNVLVTFDGIDKISVRNTAKIDTVKEISNKHLNSDCYLYSGANGVLMTSGKAAYSIRMV